MRVELKRSDSRLLSQLPVRGGSGQRSGQGQELDDECDRVWTYLCSEDSGHSW